MKASHKILTIIIIFACVILSSSILYTQTIEEIKSCVSFLYLRDSSGNFISNGTVFFVGIDDTVKKRTYGHIVTAKHVVWDKLNKKYYSNCWLRVNRKMGDVAYVYLPLFADGVEKNIFTHPDTTVDLVVIAAQISASKYDYRNISVEHIRSVDKLISLGQIEGEGEEILFPALFVHHTGRHKNYPIIRTGKLALAFNGEKIKWGDQYQKLHLIESIAIGGHSGAPVFIRFLPLISRGDKGKILTTNYTFKNIFLVGIMKGYFNDWNKIEFANTSAIPISQSHTGISAIIPVELLNDILFCSELVKFRNAQ